jgi:hypothetical protein
VREIDHLGLPGVDYRIVLRCIFMKCVGVALTGLIWLRVGTDGGQL